MNWTTSWRLPNMTRLPIVSDLCPASWQDWREAFKELFVVLLFSLMPVWLGLVIVTISTVPDSPFTFVAKFASSSDLGILSASLLGPMFYMMFRDEGRASGDRGVPRFPSGLWFTILILVCCVIATIIYSNTYLSGTRSFFDQQGAPISFVDAHWVAVVSWILFFTSTSLVLFGATIRNSIYSQPPALMSADTGDFVAQYRAAKDTES